MTKTTIYANQTRLIKVSRKIINWVRFSWLIICFLSVSMLGNAQQSATYNNSINEYKLGLELFNKEKYGAAQKQFEKAIAKTQNSASEVSVNSEYYAALCALNLFNKDAEHLLNEFVTTHPESPRVKNVYFQLGNYNFRKKKWKNVINWFDKVDIFDLNATEVSEYNFKRGYSYFMLDDFENASKELYEIVEKDTKYTIPARYYYAHIAYTKGDYETALGLFKKLENDEKFAKIVPYYITHIYYQQKKYKKLTDYAPALLQASTTKRAPEIARLIGDSYYKLEQYKEAIPYLEQYKRAHYNLTTTDRYQLGYAYYKSENYEKAIKTFNKISTAKDKTAQMAFYHLADCYLKMDNKKFSLNAFKSASEMDFDPEIKENALYNYALLSYELSYDPYNRSIESFKEYIEKYPNSPKTDEAYKYLVKAYMTTRNYDRALYSIESIVAPGIQLQEAYQRIAYNSAVEYFQNGQFEKAIQRFKKSRSYPLNKKNTALSWYWIGESNYRLGSYNSAIVAYEQFLKSPQAILQKEFSLVHYNIAYAYFSKKNYPKAIKSFRKFTHSRKETNTKLLSDANLRIGDAYFLTDDYYKAEGFYKKAIELGALDADYAMYQRAIALGLLKKRTLKVKELNQLIAKYPKSNYVVDAKFQLGKVAMFEDANEIALTYFNAVITDYPNSSYVKKSLLNKGMIYYNSDKNAEALAIFKQIVKQYPTYDDSKEALIPIQNIYVKLGKVDEYAVFMESLSFTNVTEASLDSLTYEAAEMQYMDGKCEEAQVTFAAYLSKFKTPIFKLNAHFYKAECNLKSRDTTAALLSYNFVADQPLNKFSESALVKASPINFKQKKYEEALSDYILLEKIAEYQSHHFEAVIGQMRCFYLLHNYPSAIAYANKIIALEKSSKNNVGEAHFTIARSAKATGDLELAFAEFDTIINSTQNIMSAESQYEKALIRYTQDSLKLAEEEVFKLVNLTPSYAYWVAKGLILLADIYVDMEDLFQAKATLQSILDNYEGKDELLAMVQNRLAGIAALEKPQEEEEEEPIEVDYEDDNEEKDVPKNTPEEENTEE